MMPDFRRAVCVYMVKLRAIEVPREDMEKIVALTGQIQKIKELGFSFVTLDLEGIRSGVFD